MMRDNLDRCTSDDYDRVTVDLSNIVFVQQAGGMTVKADGIAVDNNEMRWHQ